VLPNALTTSFGSTINCISIQLHGDGVIVGVGVGVGVGSVQGQIPGEHWLNPTQDISPSPPEIMLIQYEFIEGVPGPGPKLYTPLFPVLVPDEIGTFM
jgi:hypothetical protein